MGGSRGQESMPLRRVTAEDLSKMLEEVRPGRPLLVLVWSEHGSVTGTLDLIAPGSDRISHVAASPASRGMVGCVAAELDLDSFHDEVVAIDNAQWADPSSLGRLQRLLEDPAASLVLMLGLRPLDDVERWAIDRIVDAGTRRGEVVEVEMDGDAQVAVETLTDRQRDLVLAARLVASSLGVGVVARFLETTEAEALDVAESLVGLGLLRETRAGFLAAPAAHRQEAGEARTGYLSARLAGVLEEAGAAPGTVGSLWLAGGEPDRAYPHLRDAAIQASSRAALGEAYHNATRALVAAEEMVDVPGPELGELHLVCGRFLRAAGRSEDAAEHLDRAIGLLDGSDRIDALGFAAAVADDRQHPQEAERILALAGLVARQVGESAKQGSIGTFHARALNRIGFADEADRMLAVSRERLDEAGSGSQQRFNADMNRAWILFDRGQMAEAEAVFSHLRDLTDAADLSGRADKEAWRARALFGSGRPAEAIEAVETARRLADEAGVGAPLFLADLAVSDGALAYGRPEEALAAAERVHDLVQRQLPAWENVARAEKARALLALNRQEEAAEEIQAALDATPGGSDGWRWRSRCRAIQMEIDAATGSFPRREAEDLADMLLQSRYFGWAAELMCAIAEHTRDSGFAEEALAIANQVGNPMLAARAASAGKLWRHKLAAPTVRAIQGMSSRLPDGWEDDWRRLTVVQQGLAAPEVAGDEAAADNAAVLDQALRRAGLSGDEVLSPAQRRRRGLVRRRRAWRPVTVAAAVLGVVALAGLTSYAISELNPAPPAVTVVREVVAAQPGTVTTALPTLEETRIPLPDGIDFLSTDGAIAYRGDHGRSGYVDVAGPRSFGGHYWTFETAGQIEAAPVAYGRNLLVGSTDNTFYALGLSEGNIAWTLRTDGRIATAADVGSGPIMEGNPVSYAVIVGADGSIRLRDPLQAVATENWSMLLGTSIVSAPVLHEGMIYVATTDGYVFGVDTGGTVVWQFPAEGEPALGPIRADLTFADGIVYATTSDGGLYLIDSAGQEVCREQFSSGIVAAPIVTDGIAYIFTLGNTVYVRAAGSCAETPVEGRLPLFTVDAPIEVAPAIVGDAMYLPAGVYLYKLDLRTNSYIWPADTVVAPSPISAPPVVTNDTVYFGTVGGSVHAIDIETGEELGVWETGNVIRGQPLVIDNALYVASGNGTIYAIGE